MNQNNKQNSEGTEARKGNKSHATRKNQTYLFLVFLQRGVLIIDLRRTSSIWENRVHLNIAITFEENQRSIQLCVEKTLMSFHPQRLGEAKALVKVPSDWSLLIEN